MAQKGFKQFFSSKYSIIKINSKLEFYSKLTPCGGSHRCIIALSKNQKNSTAQSILPPPPTVHRIHRSYSSHRWITSKKNPSMAHNIFIEAQIHIDRLQ